MWAIPTGTSSALKKKTGKESQYMVSHPELDSDPPIGSDRESGRDIGDLVWVHLRKDRFPPGKFGKLKPRVDDPFKIIEKIGENAYKLQLPDEYEISPMFNVKDLRAYHGEDLRVSLFSQLWGIDAGAFINTPNIGNSALIIEELDWGGQDVLNTCENSFFGPHLGLGRQKNVVRLGQTLDVEPPY